MYVIRVNNVCCQYTQMYVLASPTFYHRRGLMLLSPHDAFIILLAMPIWSTPLLIPRLNSAANLVVNFCDVVSELEYRWSLNTLFD